MERMPWRKKKGGGGGGGGGSKHLENFCSDMNSSGFWASASIITLCATYSISCSYSLHNVLHLVCVCV